MEWWMWLILVFIVLAFFSRDSEEDKKQEKAEKLAKKRQEAVSRQSTYAEIVPEILALCVATTEEVNDDALDLAREMLNEDNLILDKSTAFDSLTNNSLLMHDSRKKSISILKLRATTVISKVPKITDPLQNSRVLVMLEGMKDQMGSNKADEKALSIVDAFIDAVESNMARTIPGDTITAQSNRSTKALTSANIASPTEKKSGSSALKYAATAAGGALVGSAVANTASASEASPADNIEEMDSGVGEMESSETPDDVDISEETGLGDEEGGGIFDLFGDD